MKNNIKLILLPIMLIVLLVTTACGRLSDEDSIWNQTRDVEAMETPGAGGSMSFEPGVFEATSEIRGFGGFMTLEVTIGDDGIISDIEVTNHGESDDWYDMAVPTLTEAVIDAQSADVDGVSGATYTSGAFIDAVRIALSEAGGTPAGDDAQAANFTPGIFEAISEIRGFGGFITIEVMIDDDGKIADIDVTNHGESEDWYNMAVPTLTEAVIEAQSADVDGVSGATYTSGAFIDAVRIALSQAGDGAAPTGDDAQAANFTPGTFEAISEIRGFGGFMTIEVTIDDDGSISDIDVTNHGESEDWYNMAVPTLTEAVIEAQSADVDGVSGATYTSNVFIDAVRIALENAQ